MASEFCETPQFMKFYDSITKERLPLNDVLAKHVRNCLQCQKATQQRPKGLGQVSQLCSEYQDIIMDWADLEGLSNNIVAHDEFGNQAPTHGNPERNPPRWP